MYLIFFFFLCGAMDICKLQFSFLDDGICRRDWYVFDEGLHFKKKTLPNKHDCVQSKGNDSNVKEISPSALGPQRR